MTTDLATTAASNVAGAVTSAQLLNGPARVRGRERADDAPAALFLHRLDRVLEATDPFAVPDEVLDALDDEVHAQISERFAALEVNGFVWACKVDDAQVRRYGAEPNPDLKQYAARIGVGLRYVFARAAAWRRLLAPRHSAVDSTALREADILNCVGYWLEALNCADPDAAIEEMLRRKVDNPAFSTREARRLVGALNAAERERGPVLEEGPAVALASWEEWLPAQEPCELLLTDPPYSTDVDDIARFAAAWLPAALAKVKPTGRAYVFIGAYPEEVQAYREVVQRLPWREPQVLVWTYRNTLGPAPTHSYKMNCQFILYFVGPQAPPLCCPDLVERFSVQEMNAPDGRLGERYHAWEKPLELAERFIRHSTSPGDVVLTRLPGPAPSCSLRSGWGAWAGAARLIRRCSRWRSAGGAAVRDCVRQIAHTGAGQGGKGGRGDDSRAQEEERRALLRRRASGGHCSQHGWARRRGASSSYVREETRHVLIQVDAGQLYSALVVLEGLHPVRGQVVSGHFIEGVTQAELAERLSMSAATVSRKESAALADRGIAPDKSAQVASTRLGELAQRLTCFAVLKRGRRACPTSWIRSPLPAWEPLKPAIPADEMKEASSPPQWLAGSGEQPRGLRPALTW